MQVSYKIGRKNKIFFRKPFLDFCKSFANSLRSNSAKTLSKNLQKFCKKSVFAPTIFYWDLQIKNQKYKLI